jgi:hypothetical protein
MLAAFATWVGIDTGLDAQRAQRAHDAQLALSAVGAAFDTERWHEALASSVALRDAHPEQPDRWELEAHVRLVGALHGGFTTAERLNQARDAAQAFSRSIELRPRWPYAHSGYALAKAELGEFDESFDRAVRLSMRWGPNEQRVLRELASLSLGPGGERPEPVAGLLAQAFDRVAPQLAEPWVDRADRAGLAPRLCARADLAENMRKRCTQLGY